MMNKKDEDFMLEALSFIKVRVEHGTKLSNIDMGLKMLIDEKGFHNVRERARLRKAFMRMTRIMLAEKYMGKHSGTEHGLTDIEMAQVKKLKKVVLSVSDRSKTWDKLEKLDETIKEARLGTVHGKGVTVGGSYEVYADPLVFYLCSTHVSPAADHKDYQGKIYVDRYWRRTLEGAGKSDGYIGTVERYIDDNGILTVQEVVDGDPHLIWRNHCKHFFIPLSTSEVLARRTAKAIRKEHPEAKTYGKPKSNAQYRKDRRRLEKALKKL